jgi:hypothetical protein
VPNIWGTTITTNTIITAITANTGTRTYDREISGERC